MVLQYMMSGPGLPNHEIPERKTETKQTRTKRGAIVCLLLLAYIIVANVGYNLWAEGKSTSAPVRKLLEANVIRDLWAKRKNITAKPGTVTGILYSNENSCALINRNLVHEGDITNDVKVVKINKYEVEFEKDGQRWTQKVLANPNPAW